MDALSTQQEREILADLPYLVAVADAGGVTAAADELRVPQPTVSRGLARLADRVGVPMLVRSGRGVELSDGALELLPHARRALAAARAGTESAIRRAGERVETVAIAFQTTLGRTVVPALLTAVLQERPGTLFELRQGSREFCVEALESAQSDVALLSPPYEGAPAVETVRLYAEPLVLAVSRSHRFAGRRRIRLRDLAGERLLQMRPEFGLRGIVDQMLLTSGVETERAFEGEDVQTLRGLVAVGLGVAILPPADAPSSDVVEVPIVDRGAMREIGISHRADEPSSEATSALIAVAERSADWLPKR